MATHMIRFGLQGHIGRFASVDALRYPRGARVVVRSSRGLEIGEILSPISNSSANTAAEVPPDGQILRPMSVEDELLEARLDKHRDAAFEACTALLAEHDVAATLMDVEHLFDGQGLYFYFLGEPPAAAESLTEQLAATYETSVEFKRFAETLADGCGPGCGTEEAMGQGGCASCTTCAVASACKK